MSRAIILLALAGGGYFAWSRGYLDPYIAQIMPASVGAGEGATAPAPATLTPASATATVQTREESLLLDHWQWVSPWSRSNTKHTAAVMWQESRGNPNAVSPTGVVGLMQVTGATAEDMFRGGYTLLEPTRDNLRTPEGSIYFGTAYLEHLASIQNGRSQEWLIRAYNGGPAGAEQFMAGGGTPARRAENNGFYTAVSGRLAFLNGATTMQA